MKTLKLVITSIILLLLASLSIAQEKSESKKSAADFLAQAIDESNIQAAIEKFHQIIGDSNSYYCDEREINRLGYSLLNQFKIAEAIAVFKLNTELYPDSWNVWDSLGEGYIYADNKELAVQSYQKSLELNPQNENGLWTLRRMDSELAQRRLETKIPIKYSPGEQMGLQGEYLGQKPPGLKPEVFAPGIVSTRGGHEFSCTFSPDGKEFYFNRGPDIFVCRWEKEGWTAPEPAPFNSRYLDH
jgi:tetratricopeptide (TPR) repeat protein